jgi:ribosomal protein S24E
VKKWGRTNLQVQKKTDSKLLDRAYLEVLFEGKGGKLSRKEAVAMVAEHMRVGTEKVGLIALQERSGTSDVLGRFHVYGSPESKTMVHPKYLDIRLLTKEDREKLKQEKKKAKTAAPATEAKK